MARAQFWDASAGPRAHRRRDGESARVASAVMLSLLFHGLVSAMWAWLPTPAAPPDRVLSVSFVAVGDRPGSQSPQTQPSPVPDAAPTSPSRPASPSVRPSPVTAPADVPPPDVRFPALARANQGRARLDERPVEPGSFEAWQRARVSGHVPGVLDDPGGERDGTASATTRGKDRCVPASGRQVEGLYLMFDSSGSMSDALKAQALSCAQQYASAAIDAGGWVVVVNFARRATFSPPTRSMTEVALSLRGDNDPRATILPSRELGALFDVMRPRRADLVILSDGVIPNMQEVLPWYRYFLEIDRENRGYLYTLGAPGHPEVTAALREIGFEVFVYRVI